MRYYSLKMQIYRIEPARLKWLRNLCHRYPELDAETRRIIDGATFDLMIGGDQLPVWVRHQALSGCSWAFLEARAVPCNEDTFRLARARFFWLLNRRITRQEIALQEEQHAV